MAYDVKGHNRRPGEGSVGTGSAAVKSCHAYFTNDDAAAVETAGYFNGAAEQFQTGDLISIALDIDGTVAIARKDYVVTRAAGVITLTAAAA